MKTIAFLILATVACCTAQSADDVRELLLKHPELIPVWNNSATDRSNIMAFAAGSPAPKPQKLECCDGATSNGVVFSPGAGWSATPAMPKPTTNQLQRISSALKSPCPKCKVTTQTLKSFTFKDESHQSKLQYWLKCSGCGFFWDKAEIVK